VKPSTDERHALYFHTPPSYEMPFTSKILDFGLSADLASDTPPDMFGLTPDGVRTLGLSASTSHYFDTYFFLHSTLLMSGQLECVTHTDTDGHVSTHKLGTPHDRTRVKEVDDFLEFMERHKIKDMPRVSQRDISLVMEGEHLIRPWIPLDVQQEAERNGGLCRPERQARDGRELEKSVEPSFQFQTPVALLQDPYFDPFRTNRETFLRYPHSRSFTTSPKFCDSVPTSTPETDSVHTATSNYGVTLDGISFPSLHEVETFSFPVQ